MRVVGYVRVSTTAQADGYSLEVQERDLRAHCQRMGWHLRRVFVEPGSSAKTAKRPVFVELLDYCRRNQDAIDVVLVHKVDRFMRDVYHHAHARHLLAGYGIALRSATEPIADDPSGKALEGMLSVFAQFDNDVRSGRTVAGMKAKLEAGQWCWKPPRGYDKGMTPGPDAEEIRALFQRVAEGEPARHPTIPKATLYRLLRNPLYCGRVVMDKWGVDAPGAFEPLVDSATWHRVQRALDGHERKRVTADFPLKGLVRCPCGVPMTASVKKGQYRYYHSQARCDCSLSVRVEVLEERFRDLLRCIQPKPSLVRLFRAAVTEEWEQTKARAFEERKRLTWRLRGIQQKKDRLVEAHVHKQTIDAVTFGEHIDRLRLEETRLKMERYDAELEGLDVDAVLAFAERTLTNLVKSWNQADTPKKKRLQRVIFPLGVTWNGKEVGTRKTGSVFKWMTPILENESCLVTPARPRWKWVHEWHDLMMKAA